MSGRRPGWGKQRLFTPGTHLLRQMYQVNAGRAALERKSNDNAAHLLCGPQDPDGASDMPACLSHFPAGLSVDSLSCGRSLIFCSVQHASVLARAPPFMRHLACPAEASSELKRLSGEAGLTNGYCCLEGCVHAKGGHCPPVLVVVVVVVVV